MCHIWEKKGFREVRLGLLFVVDGTDTSLEGGKEGKKKKKNLAKFEPHVAFFRINN